MILMFWACSTFMTPQPLTNQPGTDPADLSGDYDVDSPFDDAICETAIDHWNSCTGERLVAPDCTETAALESDLILSLECDTLEEAAPYLPLCETVGWCDSSAGCGEVLDINDVRNLLTLSDRSTVTDAIDVRNRVAAIADIFAARKDWRGTFTTVYAPITQRGIEGLRDGTYRYDVWAEDLLIEFAGRYFENLHAHLLNQDTSKEWGRYYDLSMDCSASPLRVAASGVNVHLFIDLPYSLETIESQPEHKADFERYGYELVEVTPELIEDLKYIYNVDGTDFFSGFFLGDWVDGVFGENTMTTFSFQRVRSKAWTNGQWLQGWEAWIAEGEMSASWSGADQILAALDASGTI